VRHLPGAAENKDVKRLCGACLRGGIYIFLETKNFSNIKAIMWYEKTSGNVASGPQITITADNLCGKDA
jgi:hypothetical protein